MLITFWKVDKYTKVLWLDFENVSFGSTEIGDDTRFHLLVKHTDTFTYNIVFILGILGV